ncbi:hypothetical protein Nepgr_008092 [Nepenthes gracilis]|uniref:Uncharacterized protein n=1 Tax=Nepenthes gracilis TaxID=150966 RepID=A0AAD3XIW3_NEPGR|nr:hypothetical protein Nepgr_008092 [Nepenthes gracilis]
MVIVMAVTTEPTKLLPDACKLPTWTSVCAAGLVMFGLCLYILGGFGATDPVGPENAFGRDACKAMAVSG